MKLFISVIMFAFALIFVFLLIFKSQTHELSAMTIASPLPDELTEKFASVLGADALWKPREKEPKKDFAHPQLTAVAAISYDLTTDQLLYRKNDETKLPIASITKIMTALIALENGNISDTYVVSDAAAEVGEDSMGLSAGEELTLKDLLYGMMLPSGNDASEVVAGGSDFGRENFMYLMNKKAEDLGMTNTRFTNPTGREGDGFQYSTARDLLILARYAMKNKTFADVVSTVEYEILKTNDHEYYFLQNETNLLTSYPGVKGIKTGFTWEAGMCLVTYLEYDGHEIISVILNSQNRRDEMKKLLDYSLKRLGSVPPPHS